MEKNREILEESWDSYPLSELKLNELPTRLPLHVDPIPKESLYSWLIRLARKNVSAFSSIVEVDNNTPGRFLRSYPTIDVSWKPCLIKNIIKKTRISEEQLKAMNVSKWNNLLPDSLLATNRVFTPKNKFCPLCFTEDRNPILTLESRMKILCSCPTHRRILLVKCPQCESHFKPHALKFDQPIYLCHNCHFDLRKAPAVKIPARVSTWSAESQIRILLRTKICPAMEQLKLSPPDFFKVIYSLSAFLIHAYSLDDPLFHHKLVGDLKQYAADWKNLKSRHMFLQSLPITYLLIDGVFTLLQDEKKLTNYICAEQTQFNRLTLQHCPQYLQKYRKNLSRKRIFTRAEILTVIERFAKKKKPISIRSVAHELGVSSNVFSSGPSAFLREVIEEAIREQDQPIIEAIDKLKFEKIGVITSKEKTLRLAEETGISRRIIINYLKRRGQYFRKSNTYKNPKSPVEEQYFNQVKEAIERLKNSNQIISKTTIIKEAGLPYLDILRIYPNVRRLVEEEIDDQMEQWRKRLLETYDYLRNQKQHITVKILTKEARVTISREYDELWQLIKHLVEEARRQEEQEWLEESKDQFRQALETLRKQNKEITIKALANEVGIDHTSLVPSHKRFRNLHSFVKKLISQEGSGPF